MPLNVIQIFTPFFFVLIGIELFALWRMRKLKYYRLNDSLVAMSTGVISELVGVFVKVITLALFAYVNLNFSIQSYFPSIPAVPSGNPFGGESWQWNLLSWVIVFTTIDFCFYWAHRGCHEIGMLWATHVVHHSSEEYNLSVALRQSSFEGLFVIGYYLPLAFLGVTWQMFTVCYGINLIYQFWVHTRAIGRFPRWFEYVMNSPSHHRVHHAVNPQYQDKNYAGVFMIWDRMFGTAEPEVEEAVYGITVPIRSWNPLWANFHVWKSLAEDAAKTRRWSDKVRIFFARPGWKPADLGPSIKPKMVSADTFQKFEIPTTASVLAFCTFQFVATSLFGVALLEIAPKIPLYWLLGPALFVVLTLTNMGAILEGKRWAFFSEAARNVALLICVGLAFQFAPGAPFWVLGFGIGYAIVSLGWVFSFRMQLSRSEAEAEQNVAQAA
jgi:alkylglycerol monooxygenase